MTAKRETNQANIACACGQGHLVLAGCVADAHDQLRALRETVEALQATSRTNINETPPSRNGLEWTRKQECRSDCETGKLPAVSGHYGPCKVAPTSAPSVGAVCHDEASAAVTALCRWVELRYDGSPQKVLDRYIKGRRAQEQSLAWAAQESGDEADKLRADLATAHADVARLREENRAALISLNEVTAEKNRMTSLCEGTQRRCTQLEEELRAAQPSDAARRWRECDPVQRAKLMRDMSAGTWGTMAVIDTARAVLEEAAATTGGQKGDG